ncbi:MAG: 2-dehydropantoate 2-reductase N-terminal domain-containing protein [Hyphomicrobiales bacterium]|nr:2-dehydropantoate 2-reductase N-terminal domain-containing protein [Hyphomicrobiales bacterium]|tara:strand:+ start:6324 stop:7352 length:1029 start_codon:yes stop_codon:yes gene_type:complete
MDLSNKKILILGTGANGSCAAADITQDGYDVMLIDQWPDHVNSMNKNGLTINFPEETKQVNVDAYHLCKLAEMNAKFDYVFLFVKAYDTAWMTQLIRPYLSDTGLMIGVQNAMTAQRISDIIGPNRTLGCVVELSSELFTPGIIQRDTPQSKTWFGIGALSDPIVPRLNEVKQILSSVGNVDVVEDIISAKWMKLIINAMCMGPFAMLGSNLYEGFKIPGMRELVMKIGTEALLVGQKNGYKIVPIFGLKEDQISNSNNPIELMLDKLIKDIGPNARDAVFHDHLKGRYSEVDEINGLVVELGKDKGIDTSINEQIVKITKKIHLGELEPSIKNLNTFKKYI